MAYEVTISRFELYPREEPDSWVVGFTVTWPGNRTQYVDTTVPLEEARGKSDEEIADLAWERVKSTVETWDRQYSGKSPLVGRRYIPKEKRDGDKGGDKGR